MEVSDIISIRLTNHQLIGTELKRPHEIVSWLGAVQAQNFNMAKWAVGVRLSGITDGEVEQAINQGEIIRIHIMRPTWHLVAKNDIRWMLELTAPRIISALRSSDKILEITPDVIKNAYSVIEKELQKRIHPTRQEIGKVLTENKISCEDSRRLNHIMYHAELDGLVCNGTVRGKQQTYSLLDEKAPKTDIFHKEEALEKLARKYFQSHSPATLQDFAWWSGLTVTDAKRGMEQIKADFHEEKIGEITFFVSATPSKPLNEDLIRLLPAFDEYFVSYKDRQHIVPTEHYDKVASQNGLFKPMIIKNGKIIGIWEKKGASVATELFEKQNEKTINLIKKASDGYKQFLS
jgi:hypothetical protein